MTRDDIGKLRSEEPPDLWPEIERRLSTTTSHGRGWIGRIPTIVAAALVAFVFAWAMFALRGLPEAGKQRASQRPGGVTHTTVPSPQPIGEITNLNAVAFVDAQHGWAAGQGVIITTSDGGATWTRQYSGPAGIASLDFVDASHGWAVALGDGLLRTTDGGVTWAEAGEPGGGRFLRSVDFVSPTEGWGIAVPSGGAGPKTRGTLVRTTDGGETWATVQPDIADSVCVAGSVMFAGTGSKVLGSTDGGSTWSVLLDAGNATTSWFAADVQCPDASTVWVLFTGGGAAGSQAYAAYHSADGGATWSAEIAGTLNQGQPEFKGAQVLDAYPGPFASASGDQAVFLGQCPACDPQHVKVLRTQDAGASWQTQVIDGFMPTALSFADADHGWMTTEFGSPGRGAAILATSDGGTSWRVVFKQGLQTPASMPSP